VYEDVRVSGDARVYGNALVYGNAWVYEDARVSGDALVPYGLFEGTAKITKPLPVPIFITEEEVNAFLKKGD